MADIPSIVIDPHLVILPDPCVSSEQLEGFIDGLLEWSEALHRQDTEIFISDRCIEGLFEDGWYPYEGRITPLLNQFGIDVADEETLNNLVRSVMDRTPRLEERLGIDGILYHEDAATISPNAFLQRLGHNTANGLRDTLIMVAVSQELLNTIGCIFAASPCDDIETNSELRVTATVELVEVITPNGFSTLTNVALPIDVISHLVVCFGHNDAMQQIGALTLWGDATSKTHAEDAIKVTINKLKSIGLPADTKEQKFKLGDQFLESVRKYNFATRSDLANNLIDSCARIVLAIPKESVNEFRESKKSSADQRDRNSDGAMAWRTHLTKRGAGFRLMFWTTPAGIIEFANVGPKSELVIDEK